MKLSAKNNFFNDYSIFFTTLLIVLFGIGITFLSSFNISIKHFGHPYHYIERHLIYFLLSLLFFIFFVKFPVKYLFDTRVVIFLFSLGIIFLLLVFTPGLGKNIGNASRWVDLRIFSFQPSEAFKIVFLITLVFILDLKKDKKDKFIEGALLPFLVIFLTFFLIALEPDFSTALILLLTSFTLLLIYQMRKTFLVIILSFSTMVGTIAISNKKYLLNRFTFFFDRDNEQLLNESYQVNKALTAFEGNGLEKIIGRSYTDTINSLKNFPDVHTDFSFSVIVYVYGLLGSIFLIGIFFLLFNQIISLIVNINHFKYKFFLLGMLVLMSYEFVLHTLVNLGLFPTTGVFLPFVGYGGTALLTHLSMIGIMTQIKIKAKLYA